MKGLRKARHGRGFTLIELLVVIAIMLLLMGLLVAAAAQLRIRAMREASKAMCQSFVTAIESYNNDYRAYPTLVPGDIGDLSTSGTFLSQFWNSSQNYWNPQAANAAVVYQLLLPIRGGPYLNASSNSVPLLRPLNNLKQPVDITINNTYRILIRLASDKFDNPLNVTWAGSATLWSFPGYANNTYWGYWERTGNNCVFTTHDGTIPFTIADLSARTGEPRPRVILEVTGIRVWSSGQDGLVNTADDKDLDAVAGK